VKRANRWEADLDRWLEPFLTVWEHKVRRKWAPVYLRGLLFPGDRKSIEPMAERVAMGDAPQLHHFVATSTWPIEPLEEVLWGKADQLIGGPHAHLIVDDTALPKKGSHSVGVAHQYCGALGKQANCQSLVSLTLATEEVPVPLVLRLYMPKDWTVSAERRAKAQVPDSVVFRPKWQIALEHIRRLLDAGIEFGDVLADAGYGSCAEFRHALDEMKLRWAVGILPTQRVYSEDVKMRQPRPSVAGGRPRKHLVPTEKPVSVKDVIAALGKNAFRTVSWRKGSRGKPLQASFAIHQVRVADGARQSRIGHAPGEHVWLVCERRRDGTIKYYLSNLPSNATRFELAKTIKARWSCEQAHQQLKEELGLDHFECRNWHGLHHHALLTMIAFAFLQERRVRENIR
jgi:SRSO17 transposase